MPAKIEHQTRKQVIEDWLSGYTRDEIAARQKLGTGTITGIVKEWQLDLDKADYESIRELTIDIKKRGFTVKDAANIVRLYNIAKNNGISADDIEDFLVSIQEVCIANELSPVEITSMSKQLLTLSKAEDIPPEKVHELLDQNISELEAIKDEIEQFAKEKKEADEARLAALKQKDITEESIQEYIDVQIGLKGHGFSMDNVKGLLAMLDNCQKLGYNSRVIVSKLSTLKEIETTIDDLIKKIKELDEQKNTLDKDLKAGREIIDGLQEQLATKWSILSSIEKIKANNIQDSHVIAFAEIMSKYESEINIEKLLDDMGQYKSVAAINEALTNRNSELKRQEAVLTEAVKLLAVKFGELEAKISMLLAMMPKLEELHRAEQVIMKKVEAKSVG